MHGPCITGNRTTYGKGVYSPRSIWEAYYGEKVPKELQVCHLCENPPCLNPMHLFLGTPAANQAHAALSGRKATTPTLTERQVRAIRLRWKLGGISQVQLAKRYGVNQGTISRAINRKTWK